MSDCKFCKKCGYSIGSCKCPRLSESDAAAGYKPWPDCGKDFDGWFNGTWNSGDAMLLTKEEAYRLLAKAWDAGVLARPGGCWWGKYRGL